MRGEFTQKEKTERKKLPKILDEFFWEDGLLTKLCNIYLLPFIVESLKVG